MGDLATAFRSSPEKTNYAKLCQLIIDGGRLALKKVFDGFHAPANLQTALNNNITTLRRLQRDRILRKNQWDLLFPSAGVVPASNTFDITLLYTLLREICGLHPPASGWSNKPPLSDISLEANIVRIRCFRNELAHKPTTEFDEATFNNHWAELSVTLVRLGLDQSAIDWLKRSITVDEDQYIKLLAEWKREEDSIREQLDTVIKNQGDMQEKLDELVHQTQPHHLSKKRRSSKRSQANASGLSAVPRKQKCKRTPFAEINVGAGPSGSAERSQVQKLVKPKQPSPDLGCYELGMINYMNANIKKCYGCARQFRSKLAPHNLVIATRGNREYKTPNHTTSSSVKNMYFCMKRSCIEFNYDKQFSPADVKIPTDLKPHLEREHILLLEEFGTKFHPA